MHTQCYCWQKFCFWDFSQLLKYRDFWNVSSFIKGILLNNTSMWGTQWLRHCATNRKDAGSISDGVTGFFHWHNPPGCTIALGSTQPLTEMSTRGKGGWCIGLITLPPVFADCLKIWEPKPPGTLKALPFNTSMWSKLTNNNNNKCAEMCLFTGI
jgi:hypothetical protein